MAFANQTDDWLGVLQSINNRVELVKRQPSCHFKMIAFIIYACKAGGGNICCKTMSKKHKVQKVRLVCTTQKSNSYNLQGASKQ